MEDFSNRLVIDDNNYMKFVSGVVVNGHQVKTGLVPRDYERVPVGYYETSSPFSIDDMPLIPRSEWSERIAEMKRTKTRLSDIRNVSGPNGSRIPALDQNGQGYCWAYSTGACMQMLRAVAGLPYVPLSPHSVACKIKNFRDQGGWGCLSLDFVVKNGMASQGDWPAKSMDRRYDNPEVWEKAKQYRVTEAWVDLQPAVYDRDMTFDQVMTCLLNRIPVIGDFNWWGHSVCLLDPEEIDPRLSLNDPNRWAMLCLNSWTDNWGEAGTGLLRGTKGIPNGGAAPRSVIAS